MLLCLACPTIIEADDLAADHLALVRNLYLVPRLELFGNLNLFGDLDLFLYGDNGHLATPTNR